MDGAGTLWVCATPIGNLQDVSGRLLEVLRQADVVASEDTRRTLGLLNHFGIARPLVSYHEHNAHRQAPQLLRRLLAGQTVALVSDAGTPAISDPGSELVRMAAEAGVRVSVVPGPSAVTAALAVSGFKVPPFLVEGFLPRRPTQRRRRLEQLAALEAVLVFFEAPHRLQESLADMGAVLGDRQAVVARELTKAHEQVLRGTLARLAEQAAAGGMLLKGEFTVVVAPPEGGSGRR